MIMWVLILSFTLNGTPAMMTSAGDFHVKAACENAGQEWVSRAGTRAYECLKVVR